MKELIHSFIIKNKDFYNYVRGMRIYSHPFLISAKEKQLRVNIVLWLPIGNKL